jgi:hypothetical protein
MSQKLEFWLLCYLFGAHRSSAELAEIFMKFAIRKKKKKALSYRCCLLTFGTEERGGL